jgi:hypothetical protein
MKPEHYKPTKKEKPKGKGKISRSKSRSKSHMLAEAQEWKPVTSPQLREVYSAKIEWAKRLIPELKREAEASEEKEEP